MELNDLATWSADDFTAQNIRFVRNTNSFEKEFINEIKKQIYNEAAMGKSILHFNTRIPPYVEKFFKDKGFTIAHATSLDIQKDSYYGSISW